MLQEGRDLVKYFDFLVVELHFYLFFVVAVVGRGTIVSDGSVVIVCAALSVSFVFLMKMLFQ